MNPNNLLMNTLQLCTNCARAHKTTCSGPTGQACNFCWKQKKSCSNGGKLSPIGLEFYITNGYCLIYRSPSPDHQRGAKVSGPATSKAQGIFDQRCLYRTHRDIGLRHRHCSAKRKRLKSSSGTSQV